MISKSEAEAAVKKYGNIAAAERGLGVGEGAVRRALGLVKSKSKNQTRPVSSRLSGGLEMLRTQFGREEIARRRVTRIHDAVAEFIAGTLAKNQWMKDCDVRNELGLSSVDYAMVRQEHSNLLLEATSEDRTRVLIWVHPDCLDAARDILNGRKKTKP